MSREVGRALTAGLREKIVSLGFSGHVDATVLAQTDWASVTFAGARHRVGLTICGAGAVGTAADFLQALPELELAIPGQIVADIALVSEERSDRGDHAVLELEALTIEDS
jgi:hypothetical protein